MRRSRTADAPRRRAAFGSGASPGAPVGRTEDRYQKAEDRFYLFPSAPAGVREGHPTLCPASCSCRGPSGAPNPAPGLRILLSLDRSRGTGEARPRASAVTADAARRRAAGGSGASPSCSLRSHRGQISEGRGQILIFFPLLLPGFGRGAQPCAQPPAPAGVRQGHPPRHRACVSYQTPIEAGGARAKPARALARGRCHGEAVAAGDFVAGGFALLLPPVAQSTDIRRQRTDSYLFPSAPIKVRQWHPTPYPISHPAKIQPSDVVF